MLLQWARHGQNEANVTRTLSHRHFDGDLTERGILEAHELGHRLSAPGMPKAALLVSSPLRRARQTAEIVGARLGLGSALELEELREVDVGSLDGRRDDDAWRTYHGVLAGWRAGDLGLRFPGGESCVELCERLHRAMRTVLLCGRQGPVLVVAHGANLRAAIPTLTGSSDPGRDLATGGVAYLDVSEHDDGTHLELVSWD